MSMMSCSLVVISTMMMMKMMMVMMSTCVVEVSGAYDETDWGFQSYLDENFTLHCDHSALDVQPHNHVEWRLPSGEMLTHSKGRHVLEDGLRGSVTNMHLTIHTVQDADSGVYLCYLYNNIRKETKRGQLLRGLNLGGPKYREPFDEYRNNLMVGGLAAVVLFVPLVTACFVYKFRFQTKEQKADKRVARLEATKHQRHLKIHGKGESAPEAELSEVSVNGGKGEINPAYDNASSENVGTRL